MDSNLNFIDNSQNSILACNRSLFALRTMRMHGLSDNLLNQVFKATVLPKLLYAGPSWMGFINFSIIDRYEAFLRRAVRFGYYNTTDPTFRSLITKAENKLFDKVLQNESHVLFFLLPEKKSQPYQLRCKKNAHGLVLPTKDNRNFINRMLFRDIM